MRKADNLPQSCAVVTKSGNPNFLEPSGPVEACNGNCFTFTFYRSYEVCFVYHIFSYASASILYHCIYGCMFCVLLFNFVSYVFLLLCVLSSGCSVSLCCSVCCLCVNVYCTVLYSTVLHCTVLYSTLLYSTLLYCTVLFVCKCVLYCCHWVSTQLQLTKYII